MERNSEKRYGLQPMVYAGDPWAVIDGTVSDRVPTASLADARSFARQAEEYFKAASAAGAIETKPLLYYYAFLNLGKVLGLGRRYSSAKLVGSVSHGLTHNFAPGEDIDSATLVIHKSAKTPSAFAELWRTLNHTSLKADRSLRVSELLAQSVVGHRLWVKPRVRRERFIGVESVALLHDEASKLIWATVELKESALKSRYRSQIEVLRESGLDGAFRRVEPRTRSDGEVLVRFEQLDPVKYKAQPSDYVMEVVRRVRPFLWRTITSVEPYRRYYLYMRPKGGDEPIHQLLSVYALMFFLGSLTRYRPTYLLQLLVGEYGALIREFLGTQPPQLLYGLACHFRGQEITKAAVV